MKKLLPICVFLIGMNTALADVSQRWYSTDQLKAGTVLFKQNCASCHGEQAQGTLKWKNRDAQGFLPPPPINGTAHAWHHDKQLLTSIIKEGGARYNGKMPAFESTLSNSDIDSIIAFFQSTWDDEVYNRWASNFLSTDNNLPSFNDLIGARQKQIKSLKSIK